MSSSCLHFCKAMNELEVEHFIVIWDTPAGYPIMQTFSFCVLYHLLIYRMEYSLHDQPKFISSNLWTPL